MISSWFQSQGEFFYYKDNPFHHYPYLNLYTHSLVFISIGRHHFFNFTSQYGSNVRRSGMRNEGICRFISVATWMNKGEYENELKYWWIIATINIRKGGRDKDKGAHINHTNIHTSTHALDMYNSRDDMSRSTLCYCWLTFSLILGAELSPIDI